MSGTGITASRILVSVFALDQFAVPKAGAAKGWAARLAVAEPEFLPKATPVELAVSDGPDGLVLAEPTVLAGTDWPGGRRVQVEAVQRRRGLFLIRFDGKVVALGKTAAWTGGDPVADPPEHPEALAGFAADTLIDTPDGSRPAGDLAVGDLVTTLANGSRPLRWIGRRSVAALDLLAHPGLRPVAFAPGTIGNGRPLSVSPQQRMLIDDWRAAVYFGEDRVLVSAQALVDDQSAQLALPQDGLDYVILLCDRHEVLLAEGALSESFHPGPSGLSALTPAERMALAATVPEADLVRRRAAFPIVRNAEARALRLRG
ncbi:MAG: Hint domain-containing protein [Tabrizicola sp.]